MSFPLRLGPRLEPLPALADEADHRGLTYAERPLMIVLQAVERLPVRSQGGFNPSWAPRSRSIGQPVSLCTANCSNCGKPLLLWRNSSNGTPSSSTTSPSLHGAVTSRNTPRCGHGAHSAPHVIRKGRPLLEHVPYLRSMTLFERTVPISASKDKRYRLTSNSTRSVAIPEITSDRHQDRGLQDKASDG